MIRTITVINRLNETLELDLFHPEKSGFAIEDVTGLGPVRASVNLAEFSTMDGAVYNSAHIPSRNIVMKLILLPKPDIETTRQLSYKFFPIKQRVKLVIDTDNRLLETTGYVEANEPIIFSKQETLQVSIICPYPFFYSSGPGSEQYTTFTGLEKKFTFPWSNESTTTKLLKMGDILKNQIATVFYAGDNEIGITIEMEFLGDVGDLTIANLTTGDLMEIKKSRIIAITGNQLKQGDKVFINTIKGEKSIILLRGGVETNILNALDKDASWFQIIKGDNVFHFDTTEGLVNILFAVRNRIIYEAI